MNAAFREQVARDRALFFEEFGDTHTVNGQQITALIDDAELQKLSAGTDLGLSSAMVLMYARCEDLPRPKPAGATLIVDGRPYIISDWKTDDGVACVTLEIAVGT